MPRALITGITGQDGSYLAEQLIERGYEVHGLIRRASDFNTRRIDHLYRDPHEPEVRLRLHYGDMLDPAGLRDVIDKSAPDEIYNLAAQSHVRVSFDMPAYTAETIVMGTTNLLEAARHSAPNARFYQAGSSEMFGAVADPIQNEATPFRPRSPYAAAKIAAHHMARVYRDSYGMFVCNGILFNHESPRRGGTFVTRKVTHIAARIAAGLDQHLYLGNLDAKRDWGFAPEYMDAAQRMLQQEAPDDYVIATGETHTVAEFVDEVFRLLGLNPADHVRFDSAYLRPAEVDLLCGDASKARDRLGWAPTTRFHDLIRIMLHHDLAEVGLDPDAVMLAKAASGITPK